MDESRVERGRQNANLELLNSSSSCLVGRSYGLLRYLGDRSMEYDTEVVLSCANKMSQVVMKHSMDGTAKVSI